MNECRKRDGEEAASRRLEDLGSFRVRKYTDRTDK